MTDENHIHPDDTERPCRSLLLINIVEERFQVSAVEVEKDWKHGLMVWNQNLVI
jgi:hypothetical protein